MCDVSSLKECKCTAFNIGPNLMLGLILHLAILIMYYLKYLKACVKGMHKLYRHVPGDTDQRH